MYELHREIGRGCIFLSPLFLPLFLLFKLNFKTSSTFFPQRFDRRTLFPFSLNHFEVDFTRGGDLESIEMNSRLAGFKSRGLPSFLEFYRSFVLVMLEHAATGKCRCRVFAFPFIGKGGGVFVLLPPLGVSRA